MSLFLSIIAFLIDTSIKLLIGWIVWSLGEHFGTPMWFTITIMIWGISSSGFSLKLHKR